MMRSRYKFFPRLNFGDIAKGIFLAFGLLLPLLGSAQDSLRVSVIGNVKRDMIQLRWGVNTPLAWKQCNKYGFQVERFTVVRDNKMLQTPERLLLTPTPLKPPVLNEWKDIATSNNYAALIAQALYGEDFKLDGDNSKGVSSLIALAQELEQRYMVSMYAADLSFPAALFAGWGLQDKAVKPNERYLYRVKSAVPSNVLHIAEGSAYLTLADHKPLVSPQEVKAVFGNKSVMLTWNYGILRNTYHAYHIEKSSDGKSFRRLSDIPFMNMNTQGDKPADRMYYIDSLSQNDVKTYYRIIGVTSFGEEGPPSDVVEGKGKEQLIYVPHIHRAVPDDKGVVVEWDFDERGNSAVKEFQLQWAASDKGPFKPVIKGIPASTRSVRYDDVKAANYFVIAAIPESGDPSYSFPVLVQPVDTIPPATPLALLGTVDSLGVVRLSWKANIEKDLLGYRLYRGQTKEEEMIPLNDVAVRTNEFVDTIDVRNLNRNVYYAVTAVDQRYNQSLKSAPVSLTKPDLIPPSAPVISNYRVGAGGVLLEWVAGDVDRISSIRVYRQSDGQSEKMLIATVPSDSSRFTDNAIDAGGTYIYSVTAVTASGLESPYSPALKVRAISPVRSNAGISGFSARYDRKKKGVVLEWNCDVAQVREFELYKAAAGKAPSLWKVVKGFERSVVDTDAAAGTDYDYIVRAILENGRTAGTGKTTSGKSTR